MLNAQCRPQLASQRRCVAGCKKKLSRVIAPLACEQLSFFSQVESRDKKRTMNKDSRSNVVTVNRTTKACSISIHPCKIRLATLSYIVQQFVFNSVETCCIRLNKTFR